MKSRRIKIIIFGIAFIACLVLSVTGFVVKDKIAEEWYLIRLQRGTETEKENAAKRLGELKTTKAIPLLIEAMRSAVVKWDSKKSYTDQIEKVSPFSEAIRSIGRPSVPPLLRALADDTDGLRFLVLVTLLGIYEDNPISEIRFKVDDYWLLHDETPVLRALVNAKGESIEVREAAAERLSKMRTQVR